MQQQKRRSLFLLITSGYLILSTAGAALFGVLSDRGAFSGWGFFRMFTTDSNVLMGLAAIPVFGLALASLCGWQGKMPRWLVRFYLVAATSVALTFLTVMVLFVPFMGVFAFMQDNFFFHLLNPLVAMASCVWLVQPHRLTVADCFIATVPMVIYGSVYVPCVLTGRWIDFYNFTFGGHFELAPLMCAVMYGATFLCAFILKVGHNAVLKRER